MNMGSWILSHQGHQVPGHQSNVLGGGVVSGAILKYLFRFINQYEELETFNPGYQAEAYLGEEGEASGAGG